MSKDTPLVGEAAKAGKPVEVHAVAGMTSVAKMGATHHISGRTRALLLQKAMSDAVLRACEDGLSVSNPEHAPEIRERMLFARQVVAGKLTEYDLERSRELTKGTAPESPKDEDDSTDDGA